jgi:hypothetical protein
MPKLCFLTDHNDIVEIKTIRDKNVGDAVTHCKLLLRNSALEHFPPDKPRITAFFVRSAEGAILRESRKVL